MEPCLVPLVSSQAPQGPPRASSARVRGTGLPCTNIPALEYGAPVPAPGEPSLAQLAREVPLNLLQRGAFLH